MKNLYIIPAVLLNSLAYSQHTIQVTVENTEEPFMVYLKEFKGYDWNVLDKTIVRKNKFEFTLPENQKMIYLESNDSKNLYIKLYNVKGTTTVHYDLATHSYTLEGTPINEGFIKYQDFINPYEDKITELTQNIPKIPSPLKRTEENQEQMTEYYNKVSKAKKDLEQAKFDFIKRHQSNDFTDVLIKEKLQGSFDEKQLDLLIDFYNHLTDKYKNAAETQELLNFIKEYEKVTTGAKAPDFTIPDMEDIPQNLYENLGKYTIIDFWASWCGSCRKENPHIVALYHKYKDKGLNIIGVSLDKDKNRWVNAIEKDELPWLHVSNLKQWDDPIAELYKVNSIPKMYIVDDKGIIVARDLRGEELSKKLEELFSK